MSATLIPSRSRALRHVLFALVALLLPATLVVTVGSAGATDVTSAGPLTKITTTPDLNCTVDYAGDTHSEWYNDTACGTFVTDGTHTYGPDSIPAGSNATGSSGYVAWTPVSQVGPTGTGTAADPYTIVTTVTGGPFTVVQTDTYIVGQEVYRTAVKVTSSTQVSGIVYRAGDCYLQGSDSGRGRLASNVAPTCLASASATSPDRIEQLYPLTPGSHHYVDAYSSVWQVIGDKAQFPDTVRAGDGAEYDNGLGLSWGLALAANSSATFSHLTVFSPTGIQPLTVTKTASVSQVAPGGQVSYTITVSNPGTAATPLADITDTLPDGFSYVAGSTTGVTTDEPTVNGQTLTWSGSFNVPAASGSPGTISLTFTVTASSATGVYTNSANADPSQGAIVIGADNVAPVQVGNVPPPPPSTTSPPGPAPKPGPSTKPAAPAAPAAPVNVQPTYTG